MINEYYKWRKIENGVNNDLVSHITQQVWRVKYDNYLNLKSMDGKLEYRSTNSWCGMRKTPALWNQ